MWRGAVKPGDLYLNWDQWSFHQRVQWHRVSELISDAEGYECLIRRGVPVDEVCSRCGCVNALPYSHHCNFCSDIVIESRRSIP